MSLPGLVADYGSDSDSSNDEDNAAGKEPTVEEGETTKTTMTGRNLLECTGSSTDEDEESNTTPVVTKDGDISIKRLPNPLLETPLLSPVEKKNDCDPVHSFGEFSVFTNQYREAEKAKHSILEKHVKMTECPSAAAKGAKKQMCWKFRQGKCRFGKSCKYSHALDTVPVQDSATHEDSRMMFTEQQGLRAARMYNNQQQWNIDQSHDDKDDDTYMANAKRKRRAGVNDTLHPSKKALIPLEKQRAAERPWTMHKYQ